MLPTAPTATAALSLFQENMPTRTYRIDRNQKRIVGFVDGQEAMVQATEKIFETERFAYEIYDEFYGIQMQDLIGAPITFVEAVIHSRMEDALLVDSRFTGVETPTISQISADSLEVTAQVSTIFGAMKYIQGVRV